MVLINRDIELAKKIWESLGKHKHYQYNSGTVQSSSTFAYLGAPVWHQAVKPRDGRLLETSLLRLPPNPLLPDPDPSIWKFYLYKNVEFRCWGGQGHQLFQNMENYFQFIVALYIFPHSCHPGLNKAWKTMDCLNARGFSMQENRNFFYTVHEYASAAADMGSFKDTGPPHRWNQAYSTATKLIIWE